MGRTPLHTATEHGHEAVVKYLLAQGADKDKADLVGYTPLQSATQYNQDALKGAWTLYSSFLYFHLNTFGYILNFHTNWLTCFLFRRVPCLRWPGWPLVQERRSVKAGGLIGSAVTRVGTSLPFPWPPSAPVPRLAAVAGLARTWSRVTDPAVKGKREDHARTRDRPRKTATATDQQEEVALSWMSGTPSNEKVLVLFEVLCIC